MKSFILERLLTLVTATFTISVASLSFSSVARAATFSFESGDFSNWEGSQGSTISVETMDFGNAPSEGLFQALIETSGTNNTPIANPLPPFLDPTVDLETFLFGSGTNLRSQGTFIEGSAIQTTVAAEAGETLSFDFNFLTDESLASNNDDLAFFSLSNGSDLEFVGSITGVSTANLSASSTRFSEETGYLTSEDAFTFPSTGAYTLGFGILDANSVSGDSALLVDNIRIESNEPTAVPEPSTLLATFTALASGFLGVRKRRSLSRLDGEG